jgi:membrane associated rhomboid family serine protease
MHYQSFMPRLSDVTPAVKALLLTCIGVFVVQLVLPAALERMMVSVLGLGVEGVLKGWIWQFLTYGFLHGNFLHLILNMLGLFFLGPELERHMGARMFVTLFIFCIVLGGLGWFGLTYPFEGICVGASGGIFGIIGAFAGLFPHRQLTVLVFFVIPVTLPAWLLGALLGLMQLAYLLNPGGASIAYAAHLAGGLAGFLFVRFMYRGGGQPVMAYPPPWARPPADPTPTSAEIDAILDKIAREGIHRLTPKERAVLQKAGRRG